LAEIPDDVKEPLQVELTYDLAAAESVLDGLINRWSGPDGDADRAWYCAAFTRALTDLSAVSLAALLTVAVERLATRPEGPCDAS